jgi:hypothetical protein
LGNIGEINTLALAERRYSVQMLTKGGTVIAFNTLYTIIFYME